MNKTQEREDYTQDLEALIKARTWDGAESVARAMRGLGRFDRRAQAALDSRRDRPEWYAMPAR